MSKEQNIQAVQRGYEAFGRGDLDALIDFFADDIEWISPGPQELPTAGRRHGRAQVTEFFRTLTEVFQFEGFAPGTFVGDDDRVIVFGTSTVRFRSNGKLMPPVQWVHSFRLANGKVTHFEEIFDATPFYVELQAAQERA